MVPGVGESPVGSARRSPTVEHHPVGDSVTAVARWPNGRRLLTPALRGGKAVWLDPSSNKVVWPIAALLPRT